MSVVINTNSAANIAADNLAYSAQQLRKSLNKLSSGSKIVNPSDNAGGMAVAMKLTASANREGDLKSTIADATSYAQTQDGALQVANSILDRISQLKTLYSDPTKNTSDLANYDDEFGQLAAELTSVGSETFNGKSLFGTGSLSVATTDDLNSSSAVSVAQQDLLGAGTVALSDATSPSENSFDSAKWSNTTNSSIANGVITVPPAGEGSLTSAASFTAPFTISLQVKFESNNTGGDFNVIADTGFTQLAHITQGGDISNTNWNDVKISVANGTATTFLNGVQQGTATGVTASPTMLDFYNHTASGNTDLRNLSISTGTGSNTSTVAAATSLGSLNLSTITGAIQDVATMRANNGAEQSRLNFAATMVTTNQTNLQSAISNISDVDVAAETTNLARWNVLVQAGTSMLSQANQSAQTALKLITG